MGGLEGFKQRVGEAARSFRVRGLRKQQSIEDEVLTPEESGKRLLIAIHVTVEALQVLGLELSERMRRTLGPLSSPYREEANRNSFEIYLGVSHEEDVRLREAEVRILKPLELDQQRENEFLAEALTEARAVWERRLKQRNIPSRDVAIGKGKIAKLTERIEGLTGVGKEPQD